MTISPKFPPTLAEVDLDSRLFGESCIALGSTLVDTLLAMSLTDAQCAAEESFCVRESRDFVLWEGASRRVEQRFHVTRELHMFFRSCDAYYNPVTHHTDVALTSEKALVVAIP